MRLTRFSRAFSASKLLSSVSHFVSLTELETNPLSVYFSLIRRCAATESSAETKRIHLQMIRSGFPYLSVGSKLVNAYLQSGALNHAQEVFDEMPHRHIVTWNSMISSLVKHKLYNNAIMLFKAMVKDGVVPDEFTFSSILKAFAENGLTREARMVHGLLVVIHSVDCENLFVSSALVDMYVKLGIVSDARLVFDHVIEKDVVLVTALIVGYTQNGEDSEAIRLFVGMGNGGIKANEFTFASVLIACSRTANLSMGMQVHGSVLKAGFRTRIACQTSLLSMYSKCTLVDEALEVFNGIVKPNIVSWSAMMGCFLCNHREEATLSTFRNMVRGSLMPNEFALSTALRACSALVLFHLGKLVHACSVKIGLDKDRFVGASLIDMYGKCGHAGLARLILDDLPCCDIASLNSMITCYAQNGLGREAVELFDRIVLSGLEPNDVTYISVLSACSNAGLLDDGRRIFSFISNNTRCGPSDDHYACMVDLLGRAGRLEEAEVLITGIVNPDKVLWRALLSACKLHRHLEMATRAARKVWELDPRDSGTYILLTNLYASLGQWDEVRHMKSSMRGMKVKKDPAMSWVEVNKEVHTFMAGDRTHPRAEEIYKELEGLIEKTKELGYVADTRSVLQEMDELEKERSLYYHSEKLAVAFWFLANRGYEATCITIFKNLRVCGDCHNWIKLVSQLSEKEIIARDAKRFHHFSSGECSCHDYW